MSRAKRLAITAVASLVVLCAAALPSMANAQEIEVEGPLAGAPAVIGLRDYRRMRLQIQLHGSITLEDEYSRAIQVGGQLMFHPPVPYTHLTLPTILRV